MINALFGLGASLAASKLMGALKNQKVNVLHASPGRVRLQCDRWKHAETARCLESAFKGLSLVREARATAVTGSLLLVFTGKTLTAKQFDEVVRHAVKISESALPEVKSDMMKLLETGALGLDKAVKIQSGGHADLDSLLVLALLVNGGLVFAANPSRAVSLALGAYNIIVRNLKEESHRAR
ncbi:MAG: hypothetical protein FWF59_03495 [Turicibacter sp.]|nr:hypothetical protein [Turicibacter sp.]